MKLLSHPFRLVLALLVILAGTAGWLNISYAKDAKASATKAPVAKAPAAKVSAAPAKQEAAPKEPAKKSSDSIFHGWVMQNYRYQTTGANSDNLLETLATFNIGDPSMHKLSSSIEVGLIGDLNNQPANSPYHNIYNSFSSRVVPRLYSAYLDINKIDLFKNVRLGRQHLYELEALNFDGLSFETRGFAGFVLSAFAGVPVHLYNNLWGTEKGDWTTGFSLQWNPISRLRFRTSVVHLRDLTAAFRVTQGRTEDTLIGHSVWLSLTHNWDIYSRLTQFSNQLRNWEFASSTRFPKHDLKLTFSAYRLLKAYDYRVLEADPLSIASTYQPYTEFQALLYKGFGKKFNVNLGGSLRNLDNNQIASAYNHGYERVFGTFSTYDFLIKGFSTSTSANYYHGKDNVLKNNYFGLNFAMNQQLCKKKVVVGVGTAYYLYHYNLYTGDISNNVRTYFAEIEGKIGKHIKLKTTYEFEKNAVNGFHSGRVKLVWDF